MKKLLITCLMLILPIYAAAEPTESALPDQSTQTLSSEAKTFLTRMKRLIESRKNIIILNKKEELDDQINQPAIKKAFFHASVESGFLGLMCMVGYNAMLSKKRILPIPVPIETTFLNTALEIVRPWIPTPNTFLYLAGTGVAAWGIWRATKLFRAEFELEKYRLEESHKTQIQNLREQISLLDSRYKDSEKYIREALQKEKELNDARAAQTKEELEQARTHFTKAITTIVQLSEEDVPALQMKQDEIEKLAEKIILRQQTILGAITAMAERAHWDVHATQKLKESRERAARLGIKEEYLDIQETESDDEAEAYLKKGRASGKEPKPLWQRVFGERS